MHEKHKVSISSCIAEPYVLPSTRGDGVRHTVRAQGRPARPSLRIYIISRLAVLLELRHDATKHLSNNSEKMFYIQAYNYDQIVRRYPSFVLKKY